MPSIKSLRAFILTMEQGSLTLAAQMMQLSQPAASRLLQQLEEEFGAPLFFRDSKTLIPSREAEQFYPEASRIVASYDEVPQLLEALKHDNSVPFKVMAQTRCALGLVAPALKTLTQEQPDISIDLAVHKRTELRRRMTWDRFDVGIFALPLHIDFAEVLLLKKVNCQVVLQRSHPLAARDSLTPQDLEKVSYISVKEALMGQTVIEDALKKDGLVIPVKHEVSNAFVGLSLVCQGLGYMITDPFTIDPFHEAQLRKIPFSPTPAIEYAVCASRDLRDHPAKDRFLEILGEMLEARASD